MINMAKACNPKIKILAVGTACCYYPKFIFKNSVVDAVLNNGEWELGASSYLSYLFENKNILEVNKMIVRINGKLIETRKMNLLPGDKWAQCQSLSLVYRWLGLFKKLFVNSNGGTLPMLVCNLS